MPKSKQHFKLVIASVWIGAFSLLSVSILSKIQDERTSKLIAIVIGIVFWCSFIIGQTLFWLSNAVLKRNKRTSGSKNSFSIGLFTFFSTKKGSIADTALFISVIMLAAIIISKVSVNWVVFMAVAMTYLTFNLHCLYNSRHYRSLYQPINTTPQKSDR